MGIISMLSSLSGEIFYPRTCLVCSCTLFVFKKLSYPLCPECESLLESPQKGRCRVCGKTLVSELGTCMRCRERNFAFDEAYPLFPYRGAVRELVQAYKFRGYKPLARFFAGFLSAVLKERWPEALAVPVPSRQHSVQERGWDPVDLLCQRMVPYGISTAKVLVRHGGLAQKTLDYERRLSNMSGKIQMKKGSLLVPSIVLVDDVMTTGATLSECARVLKDAGAKNVSCLVLAAD